MQKFDVYEDIAKRTGGDIYIGVVGPVRTGKSTFIHRFMSELVIPHVTDESRRAVMTDELPQSAAGRTVMTTEPKFVPGEAARVKISEGAEVNVRMIDCVGFAVEGASGFEEDGKPRYIRTPWSDEPLPFESAAALGTQKVIREHATIGILLTTDGTITDLPRSAYVSAEERTVKELKEIGKPFIILLNSKTPLSAETEALRAELEERYACSVLAVNVEELSTDGIREILRNLLFEFPLLSFDVNIPGWMQVLPQDSKIVSEVVEEVRGIAPSLSKMRDCSKLEQMFAHSEKFMAPTELNLYLDEGRAEITVQVKEGVFYGILSEECGEDISDDYKLMAYVKTLSESKKSFDKIRDALEQADRTGYGTVPPMESEMHLAEPKLMKSSGHYGVHLRVNAPSYHIIKVDVMGEVSPILGTQQQSEAYVQTLLDQYQADENALWEVNLFGKPLRLLARDELERKMRTMPPEIQRKVKRAITKVVNEGKSNLFCILI